MRGVIPAVLAVAAIAHATPVTHVDRVVLADGDPELRRAIALSLRPWRIDLVVDPAPPGDVAAARARADQHAARFVVWRERDQLVVYDRDTDLAERRTAHAGALPPRDAAAAALSVKTMLRLPPPPPDDSPPPPPAAPAVVATAPADDGGPGVRVDVAGTVRVAHGLDTETSARLGLGAMLRPWPEHGWRFGALGELGGDAAVDRAGFKGTWSDWQVLAAASWTYAAGAFELEPWAAAGVQRSTLDGSEMMFARREVATLATVRGGGTVRYRLGRWTIGAEVGLEAVLGTPTYTKTGAAAQIFEVPGVAGFAGLVIGCDVSGGRAH
ncbi:MAG TPA: hypothetical protein VLX92_14425 [Kofleriaceae bacterium]|nr:hypothetical protein [Kofleriaceae bacterium]